MKIELVENWKELWKSYVIRLAGFGLLPPIVQYLLGDWGVVQSLISLVPSGVQTWFYTGLLVLILLARPLKQDSLTPTSENIPLVGLYGSSVQPVMVWMGAKLVPLGDAVRAAYMMSRLSDKEWNALDPEAREDRISAVIDRPTTPQVYPI